MPFLHIRIAGRALGAAERLHLQDEATSLATSLLGKHADATAVFIEETPVSGWTVAARPLRVAAYLEILISEGTNTEEEKKRFIAAAYALLEETLGAALDPVTYVVIRGIGMDAWGYGGRTQQSRRSTLAA